MLISTSANETELGAGSNESEFDFIGIWNFLKCYNGWFAMKGTHLRIRQRDYLIIQITIMTGSIKKRSINKFVFILK
jgi:hypothetical protein